MATLLLTLAALALALLIRSLKSTARELAAIDAESAAYLARTGRRARRLDAARDAARVARLAGR